jgi:predicted permease
MRILTAIGMWLRALFARAGVETEMDKEIRLHLEMETENNIRLGMSPDAARRAALVAFGGVEVAREAVRDERRTRWLDDLASDLKYALRGFRSHPAFALSVVALIALGVGANAGIFSVLNRVLLSPMPYPDGNRMVEFTARAGGGQILITPTQDKIDEWRGRTRTVEQITVYGFAWGELGDSTRGPTETVKGAAIVPGSLTFASVKPLLGRDVQPSDTLSTAQPVALLGYGLWQRVFAGRPDILGRPIMFEGKQHTVIGVMPKGFRHPFVEDDQIFTALRSSGGNRPIYAVAKLRPGVSVDDANRELAAMFTKLNKAASEDAPRVMRAVDYVSKSTKRVIYLMFGAVMVVLIIVCANVANLTMARAWTRQRELAVRAALGAGRGRLVRQMFTESLTLALLGGVVGVGVALLTLKLLTLARAPNNEFEGARLEPVVLAWGFGLSILTGVLFGLAPAIFVASHRASESLKAGTRAASASVGARRFRAALVVGEVALSAVLLVASGLLVRTIVAMQHADPGFTAHGLSGIRIGMRDTRLADPQVRHDAIEAVLEQVRAVPGVQAATLGMSLPPDFGTGMGELEIDGRPVSARDSLSSISMMSAPPEFFAITGIRLTQGRVFAKNPAITDRMLSSEVVVNETFARRFWPNGGAIGARVRRGGGPWATIVGVARDVEVPNSRRAWTKTQFYQAMPGAPPFATLILRSDIPLTTLLPSIEAAVKRGSSLVRTSQPQTSEEMLVGARETQRFTLTLIGAFASLALILAAFGLHAVIAYSVSQRTREIGVRVALGAQAADVMQLVVGQGLRLALVGIVAGAAGGFLTAQTMRAMLYQVAPGDPVTLLGVSVLLATVGVIASYLPARRAIRVDPVEALRSE